MHEITTSPKLMEQAMNGLEKSRDMIWWTVECLTRHRRYEYFSVYASRQADAISAVSEALKHPKTSDVFTGWPFQLEQLPPQPACSFKKGTMVCAETMNRWSGRSSKITGTMESWHMRSPRRVWNCQDGVLTFHWH